MNAIPRNKSDESRSKKPFQSVCLSGSLSFLLYYMALDEGMASWGEASEEEIREISSRRWPWQWQEQALASILLFDNIYLHAYNSYPLKPNLINEGFKFIEPTEPPWIKLHRQRGVPIMTIPQYSVAKLLKRPIHRYFYRKHAITLSDYDMFLEKMIDPEYPCDWKRLSEENWDTWEGSVWSMIMWISRELVPLTDLISLAAEENTAVSTNELNITSTWLKNTDSIKPISEASNMSAAFAVLLSEVKSFPKPRCLAEALEMRHDYRIQKLRNQIRRWAMALQKGKYDTEIKIRRGRCPIHSWRLKKAMATPA